MHLIYFADCKNQKIYTEENQATGEKLQAGKGMSNEIHTKCRDA